MGFALAHYDNARQLVGIERYAAGVLLAQAAVEMGTRNAWSECSWTATAS